MQKAIGRERCGVVTVSGEVGSADWVAEAASCSVGCVRRVELQVAMLFSRGVVPGSSILAIGEVYFGSTQGFCSLKDSFPLPLSPQCSLLGGTVSL